MQGVSQMALVVFPWLSCFYRPDLEASSCNCFLHGLLLGLFHKIVMFNPTFARGSSIAIGEVQTGVRPSVPSQKYVHYKVE